MDTFKTETTVKKNHIIEIENVPFDDGQEVEIVVSKKNGNENYEYLKNSLKGSVLKYDDPFKPVITSEDWDLLK